MICFSVNAQSIVGDDYKRELMKSIKPGANSKPHLLNRTDKSSGKLLIQKNDYIKSYNSGIDRLIEITELVYKINPAILQYRGKNPLNKLPSGSTQVVYMGGQFHIISTGGLIVTPSGIDLSGGGHKKLSAKSRNILINVLGMEIEE